MTTGRVLSLVFSVMWLLLWGVGGAFTATKNLPVGIVMMVLSPWWLAYDIWHFARSK